MLVYRVETINKGGCYGSGPASKAERNSEDWAQHPCPEEDPGLKEFVKNGFTGRYYFGFASMEQLEDWFPREKWHHFSKWNDNQKAERKYGISTYDVSAEHVEIGDKQAIFILDEAERIEHVPFVTAEVPA